MKTDELKKKCEEIVKKYILGKVTIEPYVEALVTFTSKHAIDWQSRVKTGGALAGKRNYVYLRELEEAGLLIRRVNRSYHFTDGFDRDNTAFDRTGAEAIERRNFRELRRHMAVSPDVKKAALEVSGKYGVEELMQMLEREGPSHPVYNKIVKEIKNRRLASRGYTYGEMGWRRNSDTWYLSPLAIRLLSELHGVDLFVGPHNRYIVPGV